MTRIGKQHSLKTLHTNKFIRLNDMLLLDIVYLDHQLCVVNTNSNNNNDLNDSVFSYFKRSRSGFEKIFDLQVPQHLSLSSTSSSDSSESFESSSSSSESSETSDLSDEDWIQYPTVKNWADEVCDTDPVDVEVPEWAKIPGLDYEVPEEKLIVAEEVPHVPKKFPELSHLRESVSDSYKNSDKVFTLYWADEVVTLEEVKNVNVPEWARIPGLDFDVQADNEKIKSSPEKSSRVDDTAELDGNVSGFTFNWADEEVSLEDLKSVEVPEWARIPGFDFNVEPDDEKVELSPELNSDNTADFDGDVPCFTFNWADEEVSLEDLKSVDIPEWARIPGFDFKVEPDDTATLPTDWSSCICGDEDDVVVPEWANIQINMNCVYENKHRNNKRSHHVKDIYGLKTIWE